MIGILSPVLFMAHPAFMIFTNIVISKGHSLVATLTFVAPYESGKTGARHSAGPGCQAGTYDGDAVLKNLVPGFWINESIERFAGDKPAQIFGKQSTNGVAAFTGTP